ncbi:metallophosphoesterase [Celeribacter sp. PS-C1]|uniref:metallophosphoesterase family protein n=1 Tax=Celeribacter sp. PS-C1 TaxID=2820813 RepID=UPI001CA4C706|nr:metallophosphoesterase [Celeribacter sp. PS-C1]MBW6417803.1 metallophosphoesterase [Celeribacter sp. PS-C1]
MVRKLLAIVSLILCASAGAADGLKVVVISDLNGSYGSVDYSSSVTRAVSRIVEMKPDLVISTGDMVAGQRKPHLSEREVRAMWAGFHQAVTDPLTAAQIPLAVTPGNHDGSAYGGFELERAIYGETWIAHQPDLDFVKGSNYPFSYAFDLGGVRFASVDVTTVGPLSGEQMGWVSDIMSGTPERRVVFSHLPLWPFAVGRETEIIGDPVFEALLSKLDVDLHLSGHHHAFYPGAVGDLGVISQACLGSGKRALIGAESERFQAITLLEFSEDGHIEVSAFKAPDYSERVEISGLPHTLETSHRRIERLDHVSLPHVTWKQD